MNDANKFDALMSKFAGTTAKVTSDSDGYDEAFETARRIHGVTREQFEAAVRVVTGVMMTMRLGAALDMSPAESAEQSVSVAAALIKAYDEGAFQKKGEAPPSE